jgi:RNA-binding protein
MTSPCSRMASFSQAGPTMNAANRTRKQLRAIGHRLNPVVIVSNGLSEGVAAEIDRALNDHELIKIRVNAADREEKRELIAAICSSLDAELVQLSGHVALLLRPALKPKAELSNLLRHKELLD